MSQRRKRRLEKQLKQTISSIIRDKLKNKSLKLLSVTRVELTPDFKMGTVYVSHISKDKEVREQAIKFLRRKEKKIRAKVTRALSIKVIPEFRFREDTSLKEAARVNNIMKELEEEREKRRREEDTG
ncbi:MAG: 30S ribosome-binding factor RbfA [bacterium]